jgi:hypothetical protein
LTLEIRSPDSFGAFFVAGWLPEQQFGFQTETGLRAQFSVVMASDGFTMRS